MPLRFPEHAKHWFEDEGPPAALGSEYKDAHLKIDVAGVVIVADGLNMKQGFELVG